MEKYVFVYIWPISVWCAIYARCCGVSGEGTFPEPGYPVPSEEESHSHYHTVVGLVIWNVVVTMLLFTVIVALFLVCTNKRRSRFRIADR